MYEKGKKGVRDGETQMDEQIWGRRELGKDGKNGDFQHPHAFDKLF